jgi:hypothetical protein
MPAHEQSRNQCSTFNSASISMNFWRYLFLNCQDFTSIVFKLKSCLLKATSVVFLSESHFAAYDLEENWKQTLQRPVTLKICGPFGFLGTVDEWAMKILVRLSPCGAHVVARGAYLNVEME